LHSLRVVEAGDALTVWAWQVVVCQVILTVWVVLDRVLQCGSGGHEDVGDGLFKGVVVARKVVDDLNGLPAERIPVGLFVGNQGLLGVVLAKPAGEADALVDDATFGRIHPVQVRCLLLLGRRGRLLDGPCLIAVHRRVHHVGSVNPSILAPL